MPSHPDEPSINLFKLPLCLLYLGLQLVPLLQQRTFRFRQRNRSSQERPHHLQCQSLLLEPFDSANGQQLIRTIVPVARIFLDISRF
ncbi:hypothetical protein D3C75_1119000 [compost metagenome]